VYVPYLFLREPLVETPLDESGGFPATKLPYIAFLQRWQSRYSRFWEDGDGSLTAYDFWMLLRSVFVVRSGSAEESALTAVGADIAAELNALEVTHAYTEAKMVADCEDYLEGWPSYGDPSAYRCLFARTTSTPGTGTSTCGGQCAAVPLSSSPCLRQI
jgi:hypothetical protein